MSNFVITIGSDSVRACVGMDRAMSVPQYIFTENDANTAKIVYAKQMSAHDSRLTEKYWLDSLTILPSNGQIPSLACPYVKIENGVVVDFHA